MRQTWPGTLKRNKVHTADACSPAVTSFFRQKLNYNSKRAIITAAILYFIYKDMRPYSAVENDCTLWHFMVSNRSISFLFIKKNRLFFF